MIRNLVIRAGAAAVCALASGVALAHAQLQSANPPVGGTVTAPT